MKYTVLNNDSNANVLSRIEKLHPDTQPLWGNMSVNDMLFHCSAIHEEVMKGTANNNKASLKQKVIRTIVLRGLRQLPKGVQTKPRYIRPKEDTTTFLANKNRLLLSISHIVNHAGDIYGSHPFFGPLNTTKWRRFLYMHLDHHLRQFGV